MNFWEPGKKEPFLLTTGFFLYASHMMLMQVPEKLLMYGLPLNDFGALTVYAAAPLLTVPLTAGIAWVLCRYFPGIYGLLTGGRGRRARV